MINLRNFEFEDIYSYVSVIEYHVKIGSPFCNFEKLDFVNSSTNFKKQTLLHQYIVLTLYNYFSDELKKSNWFKEEESLDFFYEKFSIYNISIPKYKMTVKYEVHNWFKRHEIKFIQLFEKLSEEIFYILFSNRVFLLNFNILVSETVHDLLYLYPKDRLTKKNTIKRINIPKWVQIGVFHRDQGRCIFCNCDLTKLINTLNHNNYDHIVALDKNGVNDPCNMQLTCTTCNIKKSNGVASTTNNYSTWW